MQKFQTSAASRAPGALQVPSNISSPPSPAEKAKAEYDKISSEIPKPIPDATSRTPPPLLILDLNGTLLFRHKWVKGRKPLPPVIRPHLEKFCDYIFGTHILDGKEYQNWEVIIWSSAQSRNVLEMCRALGIEKRNGAMKFKSVDQQRSFAEVDLVESFSRSMSINESKRVVRRAVMEIWDRSMMNLSSEDFNKKVQTTKDLTQVWSKLRWTDPYGRTGDRHAWGPENTVIIDDSPDKMSLQPFNLCEIKEFVGEPNDDALLKMIESLKRLRKQSNIASFLKNGGLVRQDKKDMSKSVEKGLLGEKESLASPQVKTAKVDSEATIRI